MNILNQVYPPIPLLEFEVYTLLKSTHKQQHNSTNMTEVKAMEDLNTIEFETLQYLEKRPCASQSGEDLSALLNRLASEFPKLTLSERQAIVNNKPASNIELYIIIDDIEGKFTASEIESLLQISKNI